MQWRHHGRSQLAPRPRPGYGHLGQEPGNQSASADVRNAQLSIDIELDHRRARIIPYAVLTLRSGSGAARAEDCSAGEGRRPDSSGGRGISSVGPIESKNIKMSGAFKKDDAITFATAHGLHDAVHDILDTRIHPELQGKSWAAKKGRFVELFKREGLLDEIVAQCWPARNTADGERAITKYLTMNALNEALLSGDLSKPSVPE